MSAWDVYSLARVVRMVLDGRKLPVPATLRATLAAMESSDPGRRPSPAAVAKCKFARQPFVRVIDFLDNIVLKSDGQKRQFFEKLSPMLAQFPQEACRHKILPAILTALDYAGLGNVALPSMFAMTRALDRENFQASVAPVIVKLFGRTNRAVRVSLLKYLPSYVKLLDDGMLNSQIFPAFVTGFTYVGRRVQLSPWYVCELTAVTMSFTAIQRGKCGKQPCRRRHAWQAAWMPKT